MLNIIIDTLRNLQTKFFCKYVCDSYMTVILTDGVGGSFPVYITV